MIRIDKNKFSVCNINLAKEPLHEIAIFHNIL